MFEDLAKLFFINLVFIIVLSAPFAVHEYWKSRRINLAVKAIATYDDAIRRDVHIDFDDEFERAFSLVLSIAENTKHKDHSYVIRALKKNNLDWTDKSIIFETVKDVYVDGLRLTLDTYRLKKLQLGDK